MSAKKSTGDYFGTFQDTLNKRAPSTPSDSSAPGPAQANPDALSFGVTGGEPTLGMVLRVLLAREPRSIPEIASELGAPVQTVAGMLMSMQSSGLVTVAGEAYQESVTITDAGRGIAALA